MGENFTPAKKAELLAIEIGRGSLCLATEAYENAITEGDEEGMLVFREQIEITFENLDDALI